MATEFSRKTLIICAVAAMISGCAKSPKVETVLPAPSARLQAVEISCEHFATKFKELSSKPDLLLKFQQIANQIKGPVNIGDIQIDRTVYRRFVADLFESARNATTEKFLGENARCLTIKSQSKPGSFGEVMVTGYFTPVIPASHVKSTRFSEPVYATPSNILYLDPKDFGLPPSKRALRAEVVGKKVKPYRTRAEISSSTTPVAQILAWVAPIDLFHAQVQGSCTLQFEDGTLSNLEYAEKNGQPYLAIGAEAPVEAPISWEKIEEYLRALPPTELHDALNRNPSYVFFRYSKVTARTKSGHPAIAEHTLAVDPAVYSLGTVGLLAIKEGPEAVVIAHDIGGAIKGPSRVDWYLGVGSEPGARAGKMRESGQFVIIAPR